MARRSLKDLKQQLDKQESKGGNSSGGVFYPFWKLPFDGQSKLRILEDPDQDNPLAVYLDYLEHRLKIGDQQVTIPCPKNKGKSTPCPICELSSKLYKSGNEQRGKYFYRDAYALLRAIVTKDGLEYDDEDDTAQGKVKAFKFSFQVSQKLKVEIGKLDDDDMFWDLDEGLDFIIEKSKKQVGDKEYGQYDLGSGFARKNTSVKDEWREEIPEEPLSDLIPEIPSYDEVAELLEKHLRDVSGQGSDDDEDDNVESEDELMAKLKRNQGEKKKDKKKDKKAEVVEEDDDADDDATDAIAALASDDDDDDDDILSMLGDDDDD